MAIGLRSALYFYDGTNVWFEAIDADGDGPADPALNFYLWGPAVDQLLARTDAENGQTL